MQTRFLYFRQRAIWVKVFKNGPSKICVRQPLKKFEGYGLPKETMSLQLLERESSTNFTWSIHEYLDPFIEGYDLIKMNRSRR